MSHHSFNKRMIHQKIRHRTFSHFVYTHLLTKECYIKRNRRWVIHICNKRMPHHKIPTSQLFVYISHLLTKECYIKRYNKNTKRMLFTFPTIKQKNVTSNDTDKDHFVYISHILTKECYIERYQQHLCLHFPPLNKRMLHQKIQTNTSLFTFHNF